MLEEQERERVLREAQDRIRDVVRRRLAEAKARLPAGDALVDSIRGQVTREREMHWTDAVELCAKEAATGAMVGASSTQPLPNLRNCG